MEERLKEILAEAADVNPEEIQSDTRLDPSMIPEMEKSPEEWIGYPLQYSWASLVAQMVKNPPAMQETPVQFLGQEDLLEKEQATHFSIPGLPWWLRW